jgi:hypothetical protein
VGQLDANAHGEVLEAGRVPGCYLGLLLDLTDDSQDAGCWWSPRPRCCTLVFLGRTALYCTSY